MFIEPAAYHLAVLRPFVIRIKSRVDAHEAFPLVVNECEHVFLLCIRKVQFTSRAGKYKGIEVVEVFPLVRPFPW